MTAKLSSPGTRIINILLAGAETFLVGEADRMDGFGIVQEPMNTPAEVLCRIMRKPALCVIEALAAHSDIAYGFSAVALVAKISEQDERKKFTAMFEAMLEEQYKKGTASHSQRETVIGIGIGLNTRPLCEISARFLVDHAKEDWASEGMIAENYGSFLILAAQEVTSSDLSARIVTAYTEYNEKLAAKGLTDCVMENAMMALTDEVLIDEAVGLINRHGPDAPPEHAREAYLQVIEKFPRPTDLTHRLQQRLDGQS